MTRPDQTDNALTQVLCERQPHSITLKEILFEDCLCVREKDSVDNDNENNCGSI